MASSSYRIVFFLQGEGRGHLTQALTLKRIFEAAGHEVIAAFVGRSKRREIPSFFAEAFPDRLYAYQSPNFVTDANDQGIRIWKSIFTNVRQIPTFVGELHSIHTQLKALQPDVVINFYDILPSVYHLIYRPKHPFVCIANQYLIEHPEFLHPKGHFRDKNLMRLFTWATSWRSRQKWALSLVNLSNIPNKRLTVTPPLIRDEVRNLPQKSKEDFVLAYVVNNGYAEQLLAWQKDHAEIKVHFFWDNPNVPEVYEAQPNFTFHRVDQEKYLDMLSRCKGIAGTAGFQTTCEAMYLKKPFVVVAVQNQYEQLANAHFIEKYGLGKHVETLNLAYFLTEEQGGAKAINEQEANKHEAWFNSANEAYLQALHQAVSNP